MLFISSIFFLRAKSKAVLFLLCGLIIAGCTLGKAALEDKVKELQREVTRLKAENVNEKARNSSLDDKLVITEGKLKSCGDENRKPQLQVVRISPEEESGIAQASEESDEDQAQEKGDEKSEDKIAGERPVIREGRSRPRLVLHSSSEGSYDPSGSQESSASLLPVAENDSGNSWERKSWDFGADNLGVVPTEGSEGGVQLEGDPLEKFNTAYRAYANRSYDEALSAFSEFLRDNAGHQYAADAVFWRGECYMAQSKMLKAIGEFERLLQRYPGSQKAASALYRIGFAYDQLNDQTKALEYYFQVVDRYRGSDAANRAIRRVQIIQKNKAQSGDIVSTAAER